MTSKWTAKTTKVAPSEDYVIGMGGAAYYIRWQELQPGMSFIIPTALSASEVARALSPAASFFSYRLFCEEIIWHDMTAVRVHRLRERFFSAP